MEPEPLLVDLLMQLVPRVSVSPAAVDLEPPEVAALPLASWSAVSSAENFYRGLQ